MLEVVKHIIALALGIFFGLWLVKSCEAQTVNYYDKNGQLFMQSNRVNNQVIYTDPVGRLVATQNSVATPVFPPLTPNLAPPRGILVSTELPQPPQLPTLEIFK